MEGVRAGLLAMGELRVTSSENQTANERDFDLRYSLLTFPAFTDAR